MKHGMKCAIGVGHCALSARASSPQHHVLHLGLYMSYPHEHSSTARAKQASSENMDETSSAIMDVALACLQWLPTERGVRYNSGIPKSSTNGTRLE